MSERGLPAMRPVHQAVSRMFHVWLGFFKLFPWVRLCCPVLYAPFDKCFRVRERERFWPKSRKRRATKSEFTTMLRAMSKMATQQNGIIDRGDLHPTYHPPTTRQSSGDLVSLLQANNQPHATINHASSRAV